MPLPESLQEPPEKRDTARFKHQALSGLFSPGLHNTADPVGALSIFVSGHLVDWDAILPTLVSVGLSVIGVFLPRDLTGCSSTL